MATACHRGVRVPTFEGVTSKTRGNAVARFLETPPGWVRRAVRVETGVELALGSAALLLIFGLVLFQAAQRYLPIEGWAGTGELARFALQQVLDAKHLGSLLDAALDLLLGGLAQLETKSHVIVDRHVRVKGVRLEDHGDVPVLGRDVVDNLVADQDATIADVFQACQAAQGGRLAAT